MKYHIIHKISQNCFDIANHRKLISLIEQLQKEGFVLSDYRSVFNISECEHKISSDSNFILFSGFQEEEQRDLFEIFGQDSHDDMLEQKTFGTKIQKGGITCYLLLDWNENYLELVNDMKVTKLQSSDSILSSLVVKLCGIRKSKLNKEMEKLCTIDPFVTITTDIMEIKKTPNVCEGSLKEELFGELLDVKIYLNKILKEEKESVSWKTSIKEEFMKSFGTNIYSFDEQESLESLLIGILNKKGLTLTAAESCTGGLFMANMINVSGASSVIDRSFVTYANEAKEQCLGVSHETLIAFGAVSKQTAGEMARGAAKAANASVSISITGIAGPLGGTPTKPVGTVYLSCYYKENTHTILLSGTGTRDEIRNQTVQMAKTMLLQVLLENEF